MKLCHHVVPRTLRETHHQQWVYDFESCTELGISKFRFLSGVLCASFTVRMHHTNDQNPMILRSYALLLAGLVAVSSYAAVDALDGRDHQYAPSSPEYQDDSELVTIYP